MMNLSLSLLFLSCISGEQVTACYEGSQNFLSLYWKSPKALLRARFPSTLESSTKCLAASIL
jgi:hypothetical protein